MCKKPRRLVDSSDEENEAERDKLKDLVQRLPCYQGEGSLAIKTKKSVEEDMRQLEEMGKQLKEEMDKVDNVKNKVITVIHMNTNTTTKHIITLVCC